MSKERTPPKKFHLQRNQFHDIEAYVPPPSRDPIVAAERRRYPNTLVLDQQARAAQVLAKFAVFEFDSPSEERYAQQLIARPSLGSSSYELQGSTMYSITDLAHVAEGSTKRNNTWYQTNEGLHENFMRQITQAAEMADLYLTSKRHGNHELSQRRGTLTGKYLANASFSAIMLDMPDRVRGQDPFDIQMAVREHTMQFVEEVGEYGRDLGVLPSVAQLVEPDSPLAVDIRRTAPTPVLRAYESTLQDFPERLAA